MTSPLERSNYVPNLAYWDIEKNSGAKTTEISSKKPKRYLKKIYTTDFDALFCAKRLRGLCTFVSIDSDVPVGWIPSFL